MGSIVWSCGRAVQFKGMKTRNFYNEPFLTDKNHEENKGWGDSDYVCHMSHMWWYDKRGEGKIEQTLMIMCYV